MAKAEYTDEQRLEAFSRIKEGDKMADLVTELGVPYPTLLKWKKELKQAEEEGTVSKLLRVDKLVAEEAAKKMEEKLKELAIQDADAEAIEGEVEKAFEGIMGIQALNGELQEAARKIVKRLNSMLLLAESPDELNTLVDCISKLQNAFFNKNGTQVAIFNGNERHPLGQFKDMMGD